MCVHELVVSATLDLADSGVLPDVYVCGSFQLGQELLPEGPIADLAPVVLFLLVDLGPVDLQVDEVLYSDVPRGEPVFGHLHVEQCDFRFSDSVEVEAVPDGLGTGT